MALQTLKEQIIAESRRLGIDKIGFTHAEPFNELEDSLHEQRERVGRAFKPATRIRL